MQFQSSIYLYLIVLSLVMLISSVTVKNSLANCHAHVYPSSKDEGPELKQISP